MSGPSSTPNIAQYLGNQNNDGTFLGYSATSKISLYGVTPIAQRSLAAQATSLVGTASSADVNTDLKAAILEIMNTLTALGAWKGSA